MRHLAHRRSLRAVMTADLPALPPLPLDCQQRLAAWTADGRRRLLGLVGPPGAGKSTLAAALHAAAPTRTQVVPMDGFHLAHVALTRLGRADRKGAPDTFDASGFVALLRRLRQQGPDEVVYAPEFRREIEEPVAGAIAIQPDTPLLIVEGNYLLLDEGPWAAVTACLDEVWYVDVDEALRLSRLLARHERFGRSPQAARDWVAQTDEPNARRIAEGRERAHRQVRWDA
jgi:pantothenate kinase